MRDVYILLVNLLLCDRLVPMVVLDIAFNEQSPASGQVKKNWIGLQWASGGNIVRNEMTAGSLTRVFPLCFPSPLSGNALLHGAEHSIQLSSTPLLLNGGKL